MYKMSEVESHSTPPRRSGYAIKVQNQRDQPTDRRTATLSPPIKADNFSQLASVLRNSRREKQEGEKPVFWLFKTNVALNPYYSRYCTHQQWSHREEHIFDIFPMRLLVSPLILLICITDKALMTVIVLGKIVSSHWLIFWSLYCFQISTCPVQSRCYPGFLSSFSFPCFVSTLARLSVVMVGDIMGQWRAMTAVLREPAVVMALATSFVAIVTGAVGGIAGVKGMSMMSMIWNVLRTMMWTETVSSISPRQTVKWVCMQCNIVICTYCIRYSSRTVCSTSSLF